MFLTSRIYSPLPSPLGIFSLINSNGRESNPGLAVPCHALPLSYRWMVHYKSQILLFTELVFRFNFSVSLSILKISLCSFLANSSSFIICSEHSISNASLYSDFLFGYNLLILMLEHTAINTTFIIFSRKMAITTPIIIFSTSFPLPIPDSALQPSFQSAHNNV